MSVCASLFGCVIAQGDAAFLHYRPTETRSSTTSGSTCYLSYLLQLKERVRAQKEQEWGQAEDGRKAFYVKKTRVNKEKKSEL